MPARVTGSQPLIGLASEMPGLPIHISPLFARALLRIKTMHERCQPAGVFALKCFGL